MGFKAIEGNDGGLLTLIGQIRETCDELARMVSEHNGLHDDHGVTECDSVGPFWIAQILIGQGSAMTSGGSNLLESLIHDMHSHDDAVTMCGCTHPVHGGQPCDLPSADGQGACFRCRQESH